ncbi:MAG: toll/interleukin-1 receptor domain-containing protein, partial [Gammaproteobacteria bacterium]
MTGQPDIFISYAREDAAVVERLATALSGAGYACWWDRDLVAGTHFRTETETRLKA